MVNKFLTNYSNITFLNKIKDSLKKCKEFYFSVSFIKKAGLILIEDDIVDALNRGVRGRIITSTYQNFTDIESLKTFCGWMKEYKNFTAHLDFNSFGDNGFHSKGYIFVFDDEKEVIVGSSNITRFALLKNIEWNVSISTNNDTLVFIDSKNEFDFLYTKTYELDDEIIKKYSYQLMYAIEKWDMDYYEGDNLSIKPNFMQRKALKELIRNRDLGVKRSLLISATGSGKTYLAAFDARNYDAKRVLYIVHKESILIDAMNTFKKIFGAKKTYGLYTGNEADLGCDFIFSTNIMMSNHLHLFTPNEFDYIVMDECHHATSKSYSSIMSYFKPGFYLGLTATPERMDNKDVFALFDRNVPFVLRLRDAIVNDLVVPFHYYGIRDKLVDYKSKDNSKISREIAKMVNVEFIVNEIEKHRPTGKLKAIAFCTTIAHANLMAEGFIEMGYDAISLTGKNDLGVRLKAFNDLQDDNKKLEIICTVDILNEGVDIPQVNMVLFLRPTESQTIFLQQLGRGLRKYEGKEYVTVLDFIGNNYDRSIQMAMALGTLGQSSIIEKPYLMDLVNTDFKALNLPGVSIDIDSLSKEEIINYIKNENFNTKDFLIKDYQNFKKYLHLDTYPTHMDYINSDCSPNLMRLIKSKINGKKNKCYYNFLRQINEETMPIFTNKQISFLEEIEELLPLARVDEYLIINDLLNNNLDLNRLAGFNSKVNITTLNNALYLLKKDNVVTEDNKLNVDKFNTEFNEYLKDTLNYGLTRYEIEFGDYSGLFKLYGNYYKEQIMRVLCQNNLMYMKGTKFDSDGTTYIFVGLKKDKSKQERTNYKDKFLSSKIFQWESENNTTWDNSIGIKIRNTKVIHLFIRKMDDEDGITLPFTYFGTGKFRNGRESFVKVLNKDGSTSNVATLLFDIILDNEVSKEYYFDFEIPGDIL